MSKSAPATTKPTSASGQGLDAAVELMSNKPLVTTKQDGAGIAIALDPLEPVENVEGGEGVGGADGKPVTLKEPETGEEAPVTGAATADAPLEVPTGELDTEELDIPADTLFEVRVDGEILEATLEDLTKAYSMKKGASNRFQQATNAVKEAILMQTNDLVTIAGNEAKLAEVMNQFQSAMIVPLIPEPDVALRDTDAQAYLRHLDAYNDDKARMDTMSSFISDKLEELGKLRSDRLKAYEVTAQTYLKESLPDLFDREKGAAIATKLAETARVYGYSEQEIATALDPRVIMLVKAAGDYQALLDDPKSIIDSALDTTSEKKKTARKVVRLQRGKTVASTTAKATQKKRDDAVVKARKSGTVADVANML